jgi:hypothetical protein
MAKTSIATLKTWFETGDIPTQAQFENLIDSFHHKDGGETITSKAQTSINITLTLSDGSEVVIPIYTLPANMPISFITGLQEDIDNKVDKIIGKGLSTEDFTATLKTKLDGLENYVHPDEHQISEINDLQTLLDTYAILTNLADVASSGDYGDLFNKPTIPPAGLENMVEDLSPELGEDLDGLEKNIHNVSTYNGANLGKRDVEAESYFFGHLALENNTGNHCGGVGHYALENNAGSNCNGFGHESLRNNVYDMCSGFGHNALTNNLEIGCGGFGFNALANNTGVYCNGVGTYALQNNLGPFCDGIGYRALQNNEGYACNGFGTDALAYNTGSYCNGLGFDALRYNEGDYCNGFGSDALKYVASTSNNLTAIGHNSSAGSSVTPLDFVNSTSIGANSYITASNQVTLGDSAVNQLIIGTTLAIDRDSIVAAADGTPLIVTTISGIKTITV